MKDLTVRLTVKGVALDHEANMPIVILHDRTDKFVLPISIGPFEATSILMELKGIKPPRPLTHDLFSDFMKEHGFHVQRLEIYGQEKSKYKAKLYYRKKGRTREMNLRPSDGIALALRFKAPIFAYSYLGNTQTEDFSVYRRPNSLPEECMFIDTEKPDIPYM